MLPRTSAPRARPPHRPALTRSRAALCRPAAPGEGTPVSADLRRWLAAPGSLTARLRLHGEVTVEVLAQGRLPLWHQERRALGCQAAHVREVLLRVDGRAAVWARSATPLSAVKGPWAPIRGLGKRPLAELLFNDHRVQREPLQTRHLHRGSPLQRRMRQAWAAHAPGTALPRWARHSVFRHRGEPLQVLEAFAPWLAGLPCERR